ncbi:MAG: hypothetical protein BWY74_03239 [Firmicutes bacterium ADurb.Bin419]|nr:MAG: hypothetical protein BWY74_03239 [Firmicutes bacterium ADurb.Bin419]
MWVPRIRHIPFIPLFCTSNSFSITRPVAPEPRIIPLLRLSNGTAASNKLSDSVSAPMLENPAPNHGSKFLLLGISAPITIILRARPDLSISSATVTELATEEQAALIYKLGPEAPIN